MVKSFNKVFSSFVAMMTVVSTVSMGTLSFANVASAAAVGGDLIKASGPAVYYYAADGKRYVFPNEKTYFSWYADFSSVKTISDAELASYSIGGNVTTRPGTKLVKITTDPKTYAVTAGGVLHWIESETVAKALYGDAWAQRVVDVADAFFVNYTVGSSVSSAVHPDGTLITYAGDSSKYVVVGGQKRKFASDAAFTANGYNAANVITTTISYPSGADVTGRESGLADTVVTAGTPVSGALSVSLASDTPAGMTLPKNAASVPFAKYTFTAGSNAVTITGLTVHRVGVGAATDFSNVYLYDANGNRLSTGRSINGTTHLATFTSNVMVPAGGSVSLLVYGDLSSPSATGGQHSFELADAASVIVSGSATVSGSFPVRGNVFTVGTGTAGRLDVMKGSTPSNPTIGASDVEVSNFKLVANTNDIRVNRVTLYQAGTITNSDLSNFSLYQGNTVVASTASVTNDGHIVLNFNTPYLITNGSTKIFSLRAKVAGRSGRTVKTYVEYSTDVNAVDTVYNSGAAVCVSTSTSGCSSTGVNFDGTGSNYVEVTTQGGQLTNAFNGPATQNVAKGQLAVPMYKFSLTSSDSALEIRNIRFSIDKTAGAGCYVKGSAGTNYFRSIKIKNLDTGATVMGPTEFASGLSNSATGSGTITLSDTFTIQAGKTANLAIVADLASSEDVANEFYSNGTCGYKATLNAFQANDIRIVDTGEYLGVSKVVPNNAVTGNQMTVKSSTLTVALAGSPSSGTLVKKQQNVAVAGLVLTAGAQSDVLVTSVKLTCQANLASLGNAWGSAAALADCDQRITSLSLWNGATMVGLAKSPDTTSGAATISNMNLTVPAGSSVSLMVKASFSSTASTTAPYDKVAVGIAADADVTAQDKDSNSLTAAVDTGAEGQVGAAPSVIQTIMNSGTITVAADAQPASTIVIAGKDAWVPFAQYKATAQYEAVTLDRIAVQTPSSTAGYTADNSDFVAVAIAAGGAVKAQDILSSGQTATKDLDLTGNTITIPKDGSANFQIWAKLSSVSPSSTVSGATTGTHRSGHFPRLGIATGTVTGEWDSNYYQSLNVRATGEASGERVYTSSSNATIGNGMVTRKSKPVVTRQSLSNTTLANVDQDLIKFQVAADAQGSIALKQMVFSISMSSSTAGASPLQLSSFGLRRGTDNVPAADINISFVSSSADNVVDLETGTIGNALSEQNTGYVVVSFVNEESISSGNTYTLHATVANSAAGQSVTVNFLRDNSSTLATGYLVNSTAMPSLFPSSANIYHIDTGVAPGGTSVTGTFVWADNSEVPHSYAVGSSGGSRDWTNDVYVQDLTQGQTVSR